MKYDDASWHYGGQFPTDLPPEASATHIGMFVAWAMQSDLASEENLQEYGDLLDALRARKMTPAQWFIQVCDEKFVDADLNEDGNAFAEGYYGTPQQLGLPPYLQDYQTTFGDIDRIYYVADSWENYDRLAPLIDRRLSAWRRSQTPWWKRIFK